MNDEECKQFIETLFVCFPEFEQVSKASRDRGETHRRWANAWRDDITLEECLLVLDELTVQGINSSSAYREPGPFIRKLVIERRQRATFSERLKRNTASLNQSAMERKQKQAEFKRQKFSMSKALSSLRDGVPEKEALKNA